MLFKLAVANKFEQNFKENGAMIGPAEVNAGAISIDRDRVEMD
jgi:hypothetical protein